MAARRIQVLGWAAISLLASCSPPSSPSLSDQALAAVKQRRGPDYELEYVAERTVHGHPTICGYARGEIFVFTQGRLYMTEDMRPDREAFLDKNCGSEPPRVVIQPVP